MPGAPALAFDPDAAQTEPSHPSLPLAHESALQHNLTTDRDWEVRDRPMAAESPFLTPEAREETLDDERAQSAIALQEAEAHLVERVAAASEAGDEGETSGQTEEAPDTSRPQSELAGAPPPGEPTAFAQPVEQARAGETPSPDAPPDLPAEQEASAADELPGAELSTEVSAEAVAARDETQALPNGAEMALPATEAFIPAPAAEATGALANPESTMPSEAESIGEAAEVVAPPSPLVGQAQSEFDSTAATVEPLAAPQEALQPEEPKQRPPKAQQSQPLLMVWDDHLWRAWGLRHPLRPARWMRTHRLLEQCGVLQWRDIKLLAPSAISHEALHTFHDPDYVESVRALSEGRAVLTTRQALGFAPWLTPIRPNMFEAALHHVAAVLTGVDALIEGQATKVFTPAGGFHHARPAEARAGHIFNDVVLAIQRFVAAGMRVAYLDFDVTHADAVQSAFYESDQVFTISFHEGPQFLFPQSGRLQEVGTGKGRGYSVNVALPPATSDEHYLWAFAELVPPLLARFRPDVIVMQNGLGAHHAQPLAHLRLTTATYRVIWQNLPLLAPRLLAIGGASDNLDVAARGWTLLAAMLTGRENSLPRRLPRRYADRWGAGDLQDELLPALPAGLSEYVWNVVRSQVFSLQRGLFPMHGLAVPTLPQGILLESIDQPAAPSAAALARSRPTTPTRRTTGALPPARRAMGSTAYKFEGGRTAERQRLTDEPPDSELWDGDESPSEAPPADEGFRERGRRQRNKRRREESREPEAAAPAAAPSPPREGSRPGRPDRRERPAPSERAASGERPAPSERAAPGERSAPRERPAPNERERTGPGERPVSRERPAPTERAGPGERPVSPDRAEPEGSPGSQPPRARRNRERTGASGEPGGEGGRRRRVRGERDRDMPREEASAEALPLREGESPERSARNKRRRKRSDRERGPAPAGEPTTRPPLSTSAPQGDEAARAKKRRRRRGSRAPGEGAEGAPRPEAAAAPSPGAGGDEQRKRRRRRTKRRESGPPEPGE